MKCVFIFVWVLPCTHTYIHTHTLRAGVFSELLLCCAILAWYSQSFSNIFRVYWSLRLPGDTFWGAQKHTQGQSALNLFNVSHIYVFSSSKYRQTQTPLHQQPSVARWGGHFSLLYPNHFCTLFTKYQIIVSTFYGCLKKMRSTVGWSRRGYRIYSIEY